MKSSHLVPLRGVLAGCLLSALVPGCSSDVSVQTGSPNPARKSNSAPGPDRSADVSATDPLGETASKIVYLDQGWSPSDSQRFYFTSQGSQILPYDWFLALEQADNTRLFRDPENVLRFRYLPQKPDSMNPDGLPVGFARDEGRDRAWLGYTCAACHTGEVHYKGIAYRIDGGPTLADTTAFLRSLTTALKATRDQDDKLARFAAKILADRNAPEARAKLREELTVIIDRRDGYNARNFPPGEVAGYGRIDALGAILNEVYHHAVPSSGSTSNTVGAQPANAPVSLPFLWDTPQHDIVQWNGSVKNSPPIIGPLGRNVGEVIGVFADFEIPDHPGLVGYHSSVQVQNLLALESWLNSLWSPQWPAEFPAIDTTKKNQGRAIYQRVCIECHEIINRTDPNRRIKAKMRATGTDPLTALNFQNRHGKAGKLEGAFSKFFPLLGDSHRIGAEAQGVDMLGNVVIGTIVGSAFSAPKDELTAIEFGFHPRGAEEMPKAEQGPPYKGRPLNGIWATAPYLHNGSVPTLYDLLKPAGERPKSFSVGNREFDPGKVGFKQDAKGFYQFHVVDQQGRAIDGNSHAGHEYGATLTEEERLQLLEYLKSL
jgi:hypothetical protein